MKLEIECDTRLRAGGSRAKIVWRNLRTRLEESDVKSEVGISTEKTSVQYGYSF